jgi:spermidine synthase
LASKTAQRGRTRARSPAKAAVDPDLRPLAYPELFAFFGSACLLALELVAFRILAPVIGVSLYTWTSVIGVTLAGISLGNFIGGRLADARPGRRMLSYQYLAGAIACAIVLVLSRVIDHLLAPISWPAQLQVLWITTILFFLPSVVLGTFTPMIVKLQLHSLDATGRVVGRVQAAASAGSIVAVFLTGFVLISVFGTRALLADLAVVLLILAVAANPFWSAPNEAAARSSTIVGSAALLVTVVVSVLTITYDNPCTRESNYYCIKVFSDNTGRYRQLSLDLLIHGIVDTKDPSQLVYPYERLYGQVVDAKYGKNRPVRAFNIGGGTYTFPRYLERHHHGSTLVAEIDPEVTQTARDQLGLRDTPAIQIVHGDARPVLRDHSKKDKFDLVLGDAFGDIAVPYHLVTREFNELVRSHLKPDGVYLVNIVDGVHYDFLRSYMKTLMQTFPHVGLMVAPGETATGEQNTFVVVASMLPVPSTANMASPQQVAAFVNQRHTVTLTDDHVPVDQLLAPVFRQRLKTHATDDTSAAG